jgi:hypothetical protein
MATSQGRARCGPLPRRPLVRLPVPRNLFPRLGRKSQRRQRALPRRRMRRPPRRLRFRPRPLRDGRALIPRRPPTRRQARAPHRLLRSVRAIKREMFQGGRLMRRLWKRSCPCPRVVKRRRRRRRFPRHLLRSKTTPTGRMMLSPVPSIRFAPRRSPCRKWCSPSPTRLDGPPITITCSCRTALSDVMSNCSGLAPPIRCGKGRR